MGDSHIDRAAMRRARALVGAAAAPRESLRSLLLAAAFFALSALALAVAVVTMPTPWPT